MKAHIYPAVREAFDGIVVTGINGFSIKGQVQEKSIPIPCRVRLFEKLSGKLIADKSTNSIGFYEFNNLTQTKFFIVAHHPKNQYNAIIQDNVVPK